ncbi:MAG: hypothetical protein ACFFB2_07235 [Promethearchaeota archaeon]
MSEKNIILTCLWKTDDFIASDSQSRPLDDEAALIIDENTSKIRVQIPRHFSLIMKKIIERRAQSIAKSGFLVPKTQVRIGAGFDIEISKDEVIPEVLLQEGHKYSLDRPTLASEETISETPHQPIVEQEEEYVPSFLTYEKSMPETPSQPKVKKEEPEYIPTFLAQEKTIPETRPHIQAKPMASIPQKSPPPETVEVTKQVSDDTESIAGRFIIALAKTGDVYISKRNDNFSIEYSAGGVEFRVQNDDIEILSTSRITSEDQTLQQAILFATRKTTS